MQGEIPVGGLTRAQGPLQGPQAVGVQQIKAHQGKGQGHPQQDLQRLLVSCRPGPRRLLAAQQPGSQGKACQGQQGQGLGEGIKGPQEGHEGGQPHQQEEAQGQAQPGPDHRGLPGQQAAGDEEPRSQIQQKQQQGHHVSRPSERPARRSISLLRWSAMRCFSSPWVSGL